MISTRPTIRRRFLAGLVPLLLALGALPLLAPTCGPSGEGTKVFSRHSLIIPMDACYQSQADQTKSGGARDHTYTPASCPGAQDTGSVIKAYGLVYELIKANVAVYWVIDNNKTSLTGEDMHVQYNGGFPVLKYNWATGAPGDAPALTGSIIYYRGGPFVVDGSDYDRVMNQVLPSLAARFGPASATGAVNIHVSQVAFQGYAKKTLAGGWSAGGTVPPKLALLNIGSGNITQVNGSGVPTAISDPKNAEPVISGYLVEAGIGTGTASGTATGTHGEIYDRLTLEDFLPVTGSSDVHTSNLFVNGYEILWVPHWVAPGSCSNYSSASNCLSSQYGATKTTQVLKTIGSFVAEGHDLFAECAGMGSFDGTFNWGDGGTADSDYSIDYKKGWVGDGVNPSTRFISTLGLRINEPGLPAIAFPAGNFASPLLQLGDYTFTPLDGAIKVSRPQDNTGYQPDYDRLITASGSSSSWDYFVFRPRVTGSNRGTIVYLAGHSYSGTQGYPLQIAGTRLVLNTLFNLGAACTASGVACDTGKLGVCGRGQIQCVNGQPTCVQTVQPSAEVCDGLDNDCNGLVDDLDSSCYTGDPATLNKGLCHAGVRSCVYANGKYSMSACQGEVTPTAEVCNGLDDNCNGQVDENLTQACYTGPSSSLGMDGLPRGICKAGTQTCSSGTWGACTICPDNPCTTQACLSNPASCAATCGSCQVLPHAEVCATPGQPAYDENCDGYVDEPSACSQDCNPVTQPTRPCYTGSSSTLNVGTCKAGTQTCLSGTWGTCVGQVLPSTEVCTAPGGTKQDENCNGVSDEGCGCAEGAHQSCYTGKPADLTTDTTQRRICQAGYQVCSSGEFQGACVAEILPTPEVCDGWDNDCNGKIDDGATCASGFYCDSGVCVPDSCGVENICPDGYACYTDAANCCDPSDAACLPANACKFAYTKYPPDSPATRCLQSTCDGVTCGPGEQCEFGKCTQLCPAPGEESICWPGAYCQSGGCTGGSCYNTGCVDKDGVPTGELCQNGACQPNPCADVTCPSGTFCRQGDCVQSCAFVSCDEGQKCSLDGFCEPDACANVTCGVGQKCVDGSCITDVCLGKGCGSGQVCEAQVCVDDPCTGVDCPAGKCLAGQCYAVGNPEPGVYNPPSSGSSSSGCGCGEGAASPLAALLFLFLVPLARRRRAGGRGALLVLLASAALLASACKKSEGAPFQPGSCSGGWISCEGENSCIDVYTDPANCGGCAIACAAGEKCVDKVCGPASAVAPHLTALSPETGDQGASGVTVTLTGERFEDGATVRSVTLLGTSTLTPTFVDGNHLQVTFDLSSSDPSTVYLRVVNPDKVISNDLAFGVVVPSPQITSLDPSSVKTGSTQDILVHGSGFLGTSKCHLSGGDLPYALVLVTELSGGDLKCTVDATSRPPRSDYQITVVNPADPTPLESLPAALTVETLDPVLSNVSPNQGGTNEPVSFMLDGSGFDMTSAVLWDGTAIGSAAQVTLTDSQHLYVTQFVLPGSPGTHTVQVRNGTGAPYKTTATKSFEVVNSTGITLTGISPGSAYQGATGVAITVTGTGFPTNTVIQMQPPGGAWTPITMGTVSSSSAPGTASFLGAPFAAAGAVPPAGNWLARLYFPSSSAYSSTLPFRLLSNQAVLVSATPRSLAQGQSTDVTMTAANLRGTGGAPYGITVQFSGGAAAITSTSVSAPGTGNGTVTAHLDLTKVPTLLTGTYTLTVTNPNAAASNALSFNVTPGLPHVTSVSPTSAAIQDAFVTVTVNGSNFARPDSLDNGGSAIHLTWGASTDYRIPSLHDCTLAKAQTSQTPCAYVDSANKMTAYIDTRAGVSGTAYTVYVWNPGSANPPQKSPETNVTFTVN